MSGWGERKIDKGTKEKTARESIFNVLVRQSWKVLDTLPTQTKGQPDRQMDGCTTPSQEQKPARTAARRSAASHAY